MTDLPKDWLDRIFDLMSEFFGDRWDDQFKDKYMINLHKMLWFNSLYGLSYDKIKHALKVCRELSKNKNSKPPNHIKFYHYAIKTIN
jgi:hypothetical protein